MVQTVSPALRPFHLWVLISVFVFSGFDVIAQPAPPERLVSRPGDESVLLHWNANIEADIKGYRVFRATSPSGPFEQPVNAVYRDPHYVDFNVVNDTTYYYRIHAVNTSDEESEPSASIEALPRVLDDEAFLELVQQTAFDYFWYEANPKNGLIKDRSTSGSASSIAAVGFGLSALTVGVDRGWLSREEVRERVLTTLEFFWNSPHGPEPDATGYKGFYYHFLNMETGRRNGTSELSTIDTALLLGGVIHVKEYFDRDEADDLRIRALADSIYYRVEWDWAQVRPPRVGHGWRPESGFIRFDWGGYNEAMIVYLLAFGSPTHSIESNAWTSWISSYSFETHYGLQYVVFPPLFGHQYTHVWYDFRGIQDAYMRARSLDYYENSRRATLANRAYAIANPKGWAHFGENEWGMTASDGPDGYRARGAPPERNDDGTLTPTAAGGSVPFAPEETIAALRHMYDTYKRQLWWRYGFKDAYNPARNWFATDHLGIDQGPIVLMIENYRTGAIWDTFMRNADVQRGLVKAGFTGMGVNVEAVETPGVSTFELHAFPNPSAGAATVELRMPAPAEIRLVLYDLLGREVHRVDPFTVAAGTSAVPLEVAHLPSGLYLLKGTTGTATVVKTVVVR